MNIRVNEGQTPLGAKKKELRLSLNDRKAVRRTLSRLMRMRFRHEVDSQTFRDLIYGASTILGFERLNADLAIEGRLSALEQALENKTARVADLQGKV